MLDPESLRQRAAESSIEGAVWLAMTETIHASGVLPARIALLLPALTAGGVERSTHSLAAGFLARGLAVDVVTYKPQGEMLAELPAGIRVVPLRACSSLMARLSRPNAGGLAIVFMPTNRKLADQCSNSENT